MNILNFKQEPCPICGLTPHELTSKGWKFNKRSHEAYHNRFLLAQERFGIATPERDQHEQERETRRKLRPIIQTSKNEEEYTNAAVEYIKTFFRHSVMCAIRQGIRDIKEHPTIDEFIPMVMLENCPQHVYISLWKRYGSKPDMLGTSGYSGEMIHPDGTKEKYETYVWWRTGRNGEKDVRCPVCHTHYVLPYDRKEHVRRHEKWLKDSSLTEQEYRKLIMPDDRDFKNIKVPGYYYADNGLFRKIIDNDLYDHNENIFRGGDMLTHLGLEYLHHETLGLNDKQKRRMLHLFALRTTNNIVKDDELWQIIKNKLGITFIGD